MGVGYWVIKILKFIQNLFNYSIKIHSPADSVLPDSIDAAGEQGCHVGQILPEHGAPRAGQPVPATVRRLLGTGCQERT